MRRHPRAMARLLTGTLTLALTGCRCVTPDAPSTPDASPRLPDIVWVTLDTTRADHLGAYGYFRPTSPHFDAIAEQGVRFDRFVVPMATTLPTHTSMMLGVWPTEHGVLANVQHGGKRVQPSDDLVPLASYLKRHGYQTAAFVSAAPLARDTGIARGFDHYDDPRRVERRGDKTVDAALAWLDDQASDAPMFLWVHFYDPHNPFAPPPGYAEAYRDRNDDDALDAWLDARQVSRVTKRPTGQTVKIKPATHAYDGEITFMDEQLQRLLDALEGAGRRDDAFLLLAGDHGEGLNQHGQPGHGLTWGEQLHAPLVIQHPSLAPDVVPHITSAADLIPIMLGVLDLPDEDALLAQVSGIDVRTQGPPNRAVLSQTSARQLMFDRPMTYTLTSQTRKCEWAEGRQPRLWSLDDDPFELAPITEGASLDACVRDLADTLATQRSRAETLGQGAATELSDAQLEALKALGYMDDDAGLDDDTPAAEEARDGSP